MLLARPNLQQISTLTHEGKVLIVATVVESGNVTLIYTVKQDGFEDSALQNPGGGGWEAFKALELPSDSLVDPSVEAMEREELTDRQGKYLLRSIYHSAGLTANAPAQLVSHDGHLYVFRQSTRGTLLVDRFVLDGMTNTLTPKLEVRYKRSRQRYAPLKSMKITSGGQLESVDSLDFRDMQSRPFIEPTTEICPELLSHLKDGWFSVLVVPTNEQDSYRWHIFAYNRDSQKVDLLTLRAGDERVFDLQDYWFRTIDPVTEQAQYDSIPGLIYRELELQDAAGQPLAISNGLAATRYDVQREQQTQGGPQLVREASKVLLAVPTDAGTATLSFAIAADGRLAQIAEDTKDTLLRSQEREILLPLNLLDNIRPVGDSTPAPAGTIAGMSRSDDDDSPDRVRVRVAKDDQAAVGRLKSGDTIKLSNTTCYNGLYRVAKADDGSFTIDAPFSYGEIGDWEKVEQEETGLIFDGMLTGYEKTRDGKLKVQALNHGLAAGDLVQIVGDGDYGGEYPVLKHDDSSFTIERLWVAGEAVNVKLESRKRRGLVLDGKRDWIAAPFSQMINLSAGFTIEAWVKLNSGADQAILSAQPDVEQAAKLAGLPAAAAAATLEIKDGKLSMAITRPLLGRAGALRVSSETAAPLREWLHVACSFDGKALHLLENGEVKASVTIDELNKRAKLAQDAALKQLEQEVAEQRMPAATLGALRDRLKQIPASFSLRVGALSLGADLDLKVGELQPADFLQGQLADVRVWTTGRGDKAIADAMHLQLTGRETGLAGYWRLGGIAVDDDGNQSAFDFSPNANHGALHGAPYAGGITLGRTLRDGKTAAAKFSNADLFAVREGAIYVESFEFRTDKPTDPTNADGKDARIFAPSLWGRLSRGSEERQAIAPMQPNFQFVQQGDGWWQATCRFMIPEGVRLLRCFELASVAGDWGTLELRRHAIRLVSDTVTLSSASEAAKLAALASALPPPGAAGDALKDLMAKRAAAEARARELEASLPTVALPAPQARFGPDDTAETFTVSQPLKFDLSRVEVPPGKLVAGIALYRFGDRVAPQLRCTKPDGTGEEWVKVDNYYTNLDITVGAPDGLGGHSWIGSTQPIFVPEGMHITEFSLMNMHNYTQLAGPWLRYTRPDGSGENTVQNFDNGGYRPEYIAVQSPEVQIQTAPVALGPQECAAGFALHKHGENRISLGIYYYPFSQEQLLARMAQRAAWERELADLRTRLAALDAAIRIEQDALAMADPQSGLRLLAAAERAEAPLVTRQKELERLLADISNRADTERRRNEAQSRVRELTWARDARQREYDAAVAHPPTGELKTDLWGEGYNVDATHIDYHIHTAPILAPAGKQVRGVQFYKHNARLAVKIRCTYADGSGEEWVTDENTNGNAADHQDYIDNAPVVCPPGKVVTGVQLYKKGNRSAIKIRCDYPSGGGEEWVVNDPNQDSYFHSRRSEENDFIDLHPVTLSSTQVLSGLQIRKYGNRIAPLLNYYDTEASDRARNILYATIGELNAAQAELDRLNQALSANDGQRESWEQELKQLLSVLEPIRLRIAALSTSYLATIAKASSAAQAMPDLPDVDDPRGLMVQGALLPFARSATRLHAMESCAGRVTLTYQDGDGNLRQTHYDAAYDADGKGEEWLLDGYRAALALGGGSPALALPAGPLGELSNQVTIEFWAKGGADLPKANALLGALGGGERRLSIQLPNAQGEVVWEAGQAPAGGTIDSLVKAADPRLYRGRWTHWAFVKDASAGELRIYVDGKLWAKNDPKAKDGGGSRNQSLGGISQAALGSLPGQSGGWQGQLAELRIWGVALGEREIEANSVLTLSGNEPGLLAYYPLGEAQGDTARDHTGRGNHFTIGGNAWAPCTAPIGKAPSPPITLLGERRRFNGQTDVVDLPALCPDFSRGISIVANVRFEQFNTWSRIIDLADASTAKTILLANKADSRRLVFQVHQGGGVVFTLESSSDLPQGQWVHVAATIQLDGQAQLYLDGAVSASGKMELPETLDRVNSYLGKGSWGNPLFQGELEAVRLYTYALSGQEVNGLIHSSVAEPALISAEYSRVRVDANKRKSVMMLRCLALPAVGGVRLIDEQRIEELEMTWVGNAQIKPTLIGYIEGAPPIPSENLTEEQDYNGATSVELIQSSDVEYSWTREEDTSLGAEAELLIGAKSETSAGIGVMTSVEEVKTGVGAKASFAYHWQNASTVGASHSLMSSDRLELRGSQEAEPRFPQLGQRFIPKNIGYALVTSGLADVFVSKLKRSGRMIGYQVLPVEGVPMDVNTITFLINPAYTMAGSLDGLTGSRATSDRFFRHVPEMRSQYGSLYPASYFRLKEAYSLKNQIDQQDKIHESYFNQFNARYVNEGDIDRQMYGKREDKQPVEVDGSGGAEPTDELGQKIETKKKELADLKKATPVNQAAVDAKQREIDDLETERKNNAQGQRKQAGEERQSQINSTHSDLSTRANASDGLAAWQRKLETLQLRAGKRNIVNTYVWDGDGGFHAEEQQFASTVEHTVGGSLDMSLAIGGQMSYAFTKVLVELNAYVGVSMTQTMSKTESTSKGLELHVDLSGVESRGITDYRDYPILPGEKVDRYRFMSFFLENNTNHWHDFFNYVVDPEWLASNDEEARALRQAQSALPNKVWRVLHRVTYVERPALMGFGRGAAKRDEAADDIRALRDQVAELQGKVATLQNELNQKLDLLLSRKS